VPVFAGLVAAVLAVPVNLTNDGRDDDSWLSPEARVALAVIVALLLVAALGYTRRNRRRS
jgi:hypothetical protein